MHKRVSGSAALVTYTITCEYMNITDCTLHTHTHETLSFRCYTNLFTIFVFILLFMPSCVAHTFLIRPGVVIIGGAEAHAKSFMCGNAWSNLRALASGSGKTKVVAIAFAVIARTNIVHWIGVSRLAKRKERERGKGGKRLTRWVPRFWRYILLCVLCTDFSESSAVFLL